MLQWYITCPEHVFSWLFLDSWQCPQIAWMSRVLSEVCSAAMACSLWYVFLKQWHAISFRLVHCASNQRVSPAVVHAHRDQEPAFAACRVVRKVSSSTLRVYSNAFMEGPFSSDDSEKKHPADVSDLSDHLVSAWSQQAVFTPASPAHMMWMAFARHSIARLEG